MKTLKVVTIIPVFHDRYLPPFETIKDGEVHISTMYSTTVHRCLCGCGERVVLPLNHDGYSYGEHLGWTLIRETNCTISFTPSVGNFQLPCKSHYIITKNKANFC